MCVSAQCCSGQLECTTCMYFSMQKKPLPVTVGTDLTCSLGQKQRQVSVRTGNAMAFQKNGNGMVLSWPGASAVNGQ